MGAAEAKKWYDWDVNDPDTGWITSDDAKEAIDQIYEDLDVSVISSGTNPPTSQTGSAGSYYLDTNDNILYGPKAPTVSTLFTNEIGEESVVSNTPMTVISFTTDGLVKALRYYRPPSKDSQYNTTEIALVDWDQVLYAGEEMQGIIATAFTSNESGPGWKRAVLDPPVQMNAGQKVIVMPYQEDIYAMGVNIENKLGVPPIERGGMIWEGSFTETISRSFYLFVDVEYEISWPTALTSMRLLTGHNIPSSDIGNPGDLYVRQPSPFDFSENPDNNTVLYGPKTANYLEDKFFDEYDTPASYDMNNSPYPTGFVGNSFELEGPARIIGLRYYKPAEDDSTSTTLKLWTGNPEIEDFSVVRTATISNTVEGWNEVKLAQPLDVDPLIEMFVVSYDIPPNGYVAGDFLFDAGFPSEQHEEVRGVLRWVTSVVSSGGSPLEDSMDGRLRADVIIGDNWPIALFGLPVDNEGSLAFVNKDIWLEATEGGIDVRAPSWVRLVSTGDQVLIQASHSIVVTADDSYTPQRISNVANPVYDLDAANKAYVDGPVLALRATIDQLSVELAELKKRIK